jgi:hypothetical protein
MLEPNPPSRSAVNVQPPQSAASRVRRQLADFIGFKAPNVNQAPYILAIQESAQLDFAVTPLSTALVTSAVRLQTQHAVTCECDIAFGL